MKNFLLFSVFVSSFLILFSCSQSKENKVNAAFKEYVQNNFDDPSQFVEVVSVEIKDTFSTNNLKRVYRDLCERDDTLNKISDQLKVEIDVIKEKYGRTKLLSIPGFYDAFQGMIDATDKYIDYMTPYVATYLNEEKEGMMSADDFDKMRDTILYISEIKYRIKRSGELKLESIKCYSDTCYNNISFETQMVKDGDYVKKFYDLFSKNSEYRIKLIELKTDIVNKKKDVITLVRDKMK